MSTDKRHQRMLEELLAVPGNDICADCRATAPRWASVNLGIFLCVNCASVHRKMGTHRSRVKSVTLDSWTRDQITSIKSIGNKAANQLWNPNETLHPPPASFGAEDRDSEIEKYIRRKYEQGAFRADRQGGPQRAAPTSLNRAREADGRLPSGSVTSFRGLGENTRNPELNDIVAKKPIVRAVTAERDLPPLPHGGSAAPPRLRPTRSGSGAPIAAAPSWQAQSAPVTASIAGGYGNLVDTDGAVSSTLPLQLNVNGYNPFHIQQQQQQNQHQYPSSTPMPSTSAFSTSPNPAFNGFSASPSQFGASPSQFATSPNQFATSPSQFATSPGQFATSPGSFTSPNAGGGMLQPPGAAYGLSSSAPNSNMLASFDPLHPASQQQQQPQYQPQFQQQLPQQQFQPQQYGSMAGSFSPQNGFAPMQQGSYQQQNGYLSPGGQAGYFGGSPQGVTGMGTGMGMGGYSNGGGQWQR